MLYLNTTGSIKILNFFYCFWIIHGKNSPNLHKLAYYDKSQFEKSCRNFIRTSFVEV